MEFDWDRGNLLHIAAHDVSAEEAEQALLDNPIDVAFQNDEDEERVTQIAETKNGRILVVVWTWRGSAVRVVTAFDATRTMRTRYWLERGKADGS